MKKYLIYLFPVGAVFFALSMLVGGATMLVTVLTGGHVGGELPLQYFEFLNFPVLSIVLPVLGMVFMLISLPGILAQRDAAKESNVIELPTKSAPQTQTAAQHLKAA
ncbi:MAG TPA: hypothetical protein PLD20_26325 [Blastocatellia bacterium]|nr:hypothetical protein [Blastocatellia bacterium]HMX26025.1 hypothetical protein [Blastocatellia bacterium]HMY76570.1 hypothetical protein [Blastocatellia bacterium]HMZ21477.1 hypothetical protein [Blastocatellia bacterium]HNG28926.1 hypothetical protein [Blastocatellia bacterium]